MKIFSIFMCLVCFSIAASCPPACFADVMDDANNGMRAHENGDWSKAVELYTRAIDSKELPDGDNLLAYCYNNRGLIFLKRGERKKAFQDFDAALHHKKDYTMYFNRGQALLLRGDYRKAVEDFSAAIELSPNYLTAYHYRGLAYLNLGDRESARVDLKKAKIFYPNLKFN